MKDKPKYDLTFRPDSYWDTPPCIHANIMGQARRELIRDAVAKGECGTIPAPLFADELVDPIRDLAGSIHPQLMGGEYLPRYAREEVEIARVCLRSTTGDVISIRARQTTRRIYYRIVDEYQDDLALSQVPVTKEDSGGPL